MKIIFLDIDGVLNSRDFLDSKPWGENSRFSEEVEHLQIDIRAVNRLNQIVEKSEAKVVISSSWRFCSSPDRMQEMLDKQGFKGEVIGSTPILQPSIRGNEIQAWIDGQSNVENIVIIDDQTDMVHLMEFLVNTTFADGLLDEHVNESLKILGKKFRKD